MIVARTNSLPNSSLYFSSILWMLAIIVLMNSCKHSHSVSGVYHDRTRSEILNDNPLFAVTNEENLQIGSPVAYVSATGDTIIPFGKYQYFLTDTLNHFAMVLIPTTDQSSKIVAIDKNERILFDLVLFDNLPDDMHENLLRVQRNKKFGFADSTGKVVIPCQYDFAWWFENGKAKVTYKARFSHSEYTEVKSDEWIEIDTHGNQIK